ncbi:hypothetical protein Goe2_c06100 [Bacillus phage vB_BsuM-Goe2]|uniref:Uncharacterized protein n=1 Tax=Bacillus phage vB_BsuM-Goe2 TaxID=1933062 RepID=A0A217EQI9_9CAUD|nr:hypothetical protein Goe2_c06100 [Bacillus phage vB_BsuM-Goe2]
MEIQSQGLSRSPYKEHEPHRVLIYSGCRYYPYPPILPFLGYNIIAL